MENELTHPTYRLLDTNRIHDDIEIDFNLAAPLWDGGKQKGQKQKIALVSERPRMNHEDYQKKMKSLNMTRDYNTSVIKDLRANEDIHKQRQRTPEELDALKDRFCNVIANIMKDATDDDT